MAKRFVATFVGVAFLLTATLFAAGAYLLLARSHGLWMLLGAELLLNAPVPLFLQAGSPEAIALVFVTLFFALLEPPPPSFSSITTTGLRGRLT